MSREICISSLTTIFDEAKIIARIDALASEIDARYGQEPLVAVCVLKGAFMFFGDLTRRLKNPALELDFVRLSSYGMNSFTSRHVIFSKDIECDILDKHVLIVEDIVDSGHTMRFLTDQFLARRPRSVAIATLVDKSERREADIKVDFAGFKLPAGFIVGYGMDYAEHFRALSRICKVEEECLVRPEQ